MDLRGSGHPLSRGEQGVGIEVESEENVVGGMSGHSAAPGSRRSDGEVSWCAAQFFSFPWLEERNLLRRMMGCVEGRASRQVFKDQKALQGS